MSTELPTVERSKEFAKTVIPLMKEFGNKLNLLADHALELRQSFDAADTSDKRPLLFLQRKYAINWQRFDALEPAVMNLARNVSQMIEHGDLDDLTRLELQLRLAEFEDSIRSTRDTITMASPGR